MKKLLVVLTLIMVMGLGACSTSPAPYDDTDLQAQIADMESEVLQQQEDIQDLLDLINAFENYDDTDILVLIEAIAEFDDRDLLIADEDLQAQITALNLALIALEERLDNLVVTTGLNGQQDFYENTDGLYMAIAEYQTLAKEDDYIDVNDFPDYIWDLEGNYISINDLGNLLVKKYFGNVNTTTGYGVQYKFAFTYNNSEMTNEEFIARLSMLVIELSNYDFYTIDSTQLYFYLYFNNQTVQFTSRMVLLVNDKYALAPAIFFEELLDVTITGIDYDSLIVQQFCDDFILNEDFAGFVIDYK